MILVIGITGTALFYVYKDKIQNIAIEEINKHLAVPVSVEKIVMNAWRYFPSVSLELSNVVIESRPEALTDDTLLSAKKVTLQFNVFKLLRKEYHLEKVKISDASLNLIIDSNGKENFKFLKETDQEETGSFSVDLQKVVLHDVTFLYYNFQTGETYSSFVADARLRGNFSDTDYHMSLTGDILIHLIKSGVKEILRERALNVDLSMDFNSMENVYSIEKGIIKSGQLEFDILGSFQTSPQKKKIDLEIKSKRSELQAYLDVIPEEYLSKIDSVTGDGDLTLNIGIKGNLDKANPPEVRTEFYLENGSLFIGEDFELKEIELSGIYLGMENGKIGNNRLEIKEFSANNFAGNIKGNITIDQFEHPRIDLEITAMADLGRLQSVLQIDTIESVSGRLRLEVFFRGQIGDLKNLRTEDFISNNVGGEFKVQSSSFKFSGSDLLYHDVNALMKIENNDVAIESLSGKVSKSDFHFKGYFKNTLSWLFIPGEKLAIVADYESQALYLDELLEHKNTSRDTSYRLILPANLSCDLDVNVKYLRFRKFSANEISGKVRLTDQILLIDPLSFKAMQGGVNASGILNGRNMDHLSLKCNASFKQVSISDLFYGFGNFEQENMTHKNLKGMLTSNVYYSSIMSSDLKTDLNSIYVLADPSIVKGELLNYAPLMKLSGFLKLEDLRHIKFEKLENMIEIKQKQIIIPEMNIQSSTIDLMAYGTHDFDNNIDYHLQLLMSEILSAKFKRNNQNNEEFGVIEDDGLGRTTLFLKLTGSANDPVFGYDTRELKDKIKSDLNEERQDLKDAMQEEFHWFLKDSLEKIQEQKEREQLRRQENGEFIFEWEEDSVPLDSSKKKIEKIKGSKFKIEWEEDSLPPDLPGF